MSVPKKNKNKKVEDVTEKKAVTESTDLYELTNDLPLLNEHDKPELADNASAHAGSENTDGVKPETEKGGDVLNTKKFIPLSQRTAMPDVLYYKRSEKHGGVLNGVLFDIKARQPITDKYLMFQLVQQGLEDILTENLDECDER